MIKLIILDRDGVINEDSPSYIRSPKEWGAIPGSLEAIAKLNRGGYKVAVATNQSGIARGYYSLETLDAIHQKMLDETKAAGGEIAKIFFCPHGPEDNCECRKPKSGLLLQAAKHFEIDPSEILMIGDSMRDILAAKNCGAKAIFVNSSNKTKDMLEAKKSGISVYADLAQAADSILQ
ncbi:MAG: D-glycero-beta-D-manno-heptose 1,7-bisphosphate 7-phosphatase [Gammaproteobacteria bacterium]|nr:D-glycero-beta-D-manno-heptose 1,7-bisphosphate 7-phosphatase [Gammaproteobacteria bacterium]